MGFRFRLPRAGVFALLSSNNLCSCGNGMLIVTRKVGESITVGENIHVHILEARRGLVRLAIEAPRGVPVYRDEFSCPLQDSETPPVEPLLTELQGRETAPSEPLPSEPAPIELPAYEPPADELHG